MNFKPQNGKERGAGSIPHLSRSMLPESDDAILQFPPSFKPRVAVIVDAEEEFDWGAPFSRKNTRVDTSPTQGTTRAIFERFGIIPTYAVDFPVASQPPGYMPLLDLSRSGLCEIGAQLHSWVTPPYEEAISEQNSYANNLPPELERKKIHALTETIEQTFKKRPLLYRGGRYGAGSATVQILEELEYAIDCSVLPGMKMAAAAPDYSGGIERPYWLGKRRSVLEIPVTVGTVGIAGRKGEAVYKRLASPLGVRLKIPAIAARLGIVERIRLTPEGSTIEEAKRLTRKLLRNGNRIFVVSYHSPSLKPGNTPYVRDHKDLEIFVRWLENYFEFFATEIGGIPSSPSEIRDWAIASATSAASKIA